MKLIPILIIFTYGFIFQFAVAEEVKTFMDSSVKKVNLPAESREKKISSSKKKKQKKNKLPIKTDNKKLEKIPLETVEPESPQTKDVVEVLYPKQIGEKVSHLVVGLANRLDSFFGEARSDDEKNGSTLRVIPTHTFYDGRKGVSELGVNLNLKLLNLEAMAKDFENKLRAGFIGSDERTPIEGSPQDNKNIQQEKIETWHFNFESKLASRPAIYYSGKFRARKNFEAPLFLHHFSFTAGWDSDDYWSQKFSVYSDNALEGAVLLRVVNEVSWFMSKNLFQTAHGPSLIKTINKYNSVSYNYRIVFCSENNTLQHLDTSYSVNYRHGTPSKRIFIDLIPSYTYPRVEYYKEVRSVELRLEYVFGDIN